MILKPSANNISLNSVLLDAILSVKLPFKSSPFLFSFQPVYYHEHILPLFLIVDLVNCESKLFVSIAKKNKNCATRRCKITCL